MFCRIRRPQRSLPKEYNVARKRGEYQRQKEREDKINTFLGIFGLLFLILALTYGIVSNSIKLHRINHNTLQEYTGSYSYQIRKSYGKHQKTFYVFTLENGDVVTIRQSFCENQEVIASGRDLTIEYVPVLFYDGYTAVSIATSDGETDILGIEKTYRQCISGIWVFSILLFLFLGLSGFLLVIAYYTGDWKRKIKKRLNKK